MLFVEALLLGNNEVMWQVREQSWSMSWGLNSKKINCIQTCSPTWTPTWPELGYILKVKLGNFEIPYSYRVTALRTRTVWRFNIIYQTDLRAIRDKFTCTTHQFSLTFASGGLLNWCFLFYSRINCKNVVHSLAYLLACPWCQKLKEVRNAGKDCIQLF